MPFFVAAAVIATVLLVPKSVSAPQPQALPTSVAPAELVDHEVLANAGCADGAGIRFGYPAQGRHVTFRFDGRFDYDGDGEDDQHGGTDFDGEIGDPVYAAAGGSVSYKGFHANGYGNYVVIDHGGGVETWYAHLDAVDVSEGEPVFAGMQIGTIGNTGLSIRLGGDGSHLHFEVRCHDERIDPESVLD